MRASYRPLPQMMQSLDNFEHFLHAEYGCRRTVTEPVLLM
jgi:hypothetical protein